VGWLHFDWSLFVEYLIKFGAAFLLALPIAWEREQATRLMGLRTFPLVAVASCGYVVIAVAVVGSGEDAQARIIQGLMTGIGFIGGGAILKEGSNVRGTATAASVWATGALGAAAAYARFEIALILAVLTFLTLRFLTPIKDRLNDSGSPDQD
jgi:putative Mg2+ transporter-C (MgtC) family protein